MEDGHRRQASLFDTAHEDRRELRVQRFIDLGHDHRSQIPGIGFETDAIGERQQDLARVVLLTEETLVEPVPRTGPIRPDQQRTSQQRGVDRRRTLHGLRDRLVSILDERRLPARRAEEMEAPQACDWPARTEGCDGARRAGRGRGRRRRHTPGRTRAAARAPARSPTIQNGYARRMWPPASCANDRARRPQSRSARMPGTAV